MRKQREDAVAVSTKPLRVLFVEDSERDVDLLLRELQRGGYEPQFERVETADDLKVALGKRSWDVVLSDWMMPAFNAPVALALVKELAPDLPFIIVSGTIGEDTAVDAMRAGAHDFITKDKLGRLLPAVERELGEAVARRSLRDAERERQAARQLFQELFESAPDATIIVDREGVVRAANTQAVALFGFQREVLIGRSIESLVPEGFRADHARLRAEFVDTPKARRTGAGRLELTALRRDGSSFPVEISSSPLHAEPGTLVVALRDVTERRELENQLRQAQKIEAIGRLAGGIAHDFNNILGVILGHSDLMRRELEAGGRARERLEQIVTAGEHAASLTRQLLAFSRQQVLQPKILDLNVVVNGMDKMLGRLIREDIELLTLLEPQLGTVKADPGQVEQIVINLAVNARDAMPEGGRLTIETRNADLDADYAARHAPVAPGRYVMLAITDTGSGMDETVRAHIFEPFFTTKEMGKGTGLGLSSVYGIVKQSGGYIWVYSEVGVGTTFKVYLPRIDETVEGPSDQAPAPAAGGSETILIAEDQPDLREVLREMLESSGYAALVARDGAEALQIADGHQGSIDLLITDLVMPGMSGRSVADAIAAARPGIRVLYISGYTDEALVRNGVLGADVPFLSKPFGSESLLRKVRAVLDSA